MLSRCYPLALALVVAVELVACADIPVIEIHFGLTQSVGAPGLPQRWVNVHGNVSSVDGIASLTYTLNGGPASSLNIGPDDRRLMAAGDFVIEIDKDDPNFVSGFNSVEVSVVDGAGDPNSEIVTIDYVSGLTWPMPYSIDWSSSPDLHDVLDVVDGVWEAVAGGARLANPATSFGYDRLLALGDLTWQDYDVAVEITIFDYAPGYLGPTQGSATVGLTTSWQGHTVLVPGEQPRANWRPQGANLSYDFYYLGAERLYLGLGRDTGPTFFPADPSFTLDLGTTYWFKMRTMTLPGGHTDYGAKVWESGQPEPSEWLLRVVEHNDPQRVGSVLLGAHHVDATYGDVVVEPVVDDMTGPVISNVVVEEHGDFVRISWTTDEPSNGTLRIGETVAYTLPPTDTAVIDLSHRITVGGLEFGQEYHFEIEAGDVWGNPSVTPDSTFTTTAPPASTLVSDEFCGTGLLAWTFHDPLGDTTLNFTGDHLEFQLEAFPVHDYYLGDDTLPRIRQVHDDGDFLVEVEFADILSFGQFHGLLFEEAGRGVGSALRVSLSHQGFVGLFRGSFVDVFEVSEDNIAIHADTRFLRVRRTGSDWSIYHSTNGVDWIVGPTVSWLQSVDFVGVTAGNNAGEVHTSRVTSFRNYSVPTAPDGVTLLDSPDSVTVCLGEVATLAVALDSSLPTAITWTWDGVVMPGETLATLEVSEPGSYAALLDNGCDSVISDVAIVTIVPCVDFVRGDANLDGATNLSDTIAILAYVFGEAVAECHDAADVNDDGAMDVADAVGILSYLFSSAAPPAAPFPNCGADPTADTLGCSMSDCP